MSEIFGFVIDITQMTNDATILKPQSLKPSGLNQDHLVTH